MRLKYPKNPQENERCNLLGLEYLISICLANDLLPRYGNSTCFKVHFIVLEFSTCSQSMGTEGKLKFQKQITADYTENQNPSRWPLCRELRKFLWLVD